MPRLLALSDLHVRHAINRRAVEGITARPDDTLILAGDLCETAASLQSVLQLLRPRFRELLWVPGNHELWTQGTDLERGVEKYQRMVDVCRAEGVRTPEDTFLDWDGDGGPARIALLFVGYDFSFAPVDVGPEGARTWAAVAGILATDDLLLHTDPHANIAAWCHARVIESERRLDEAWSDRPFILVNHWPLRRELVRIPGAPRYIPWCGTLRTADWHRRWPVSVVVSGHLHVRATDWWDGVRWEEVSLGYPRHWNPSRGIDAYVREILPGTPRPPFVDTLWYR